MKFKIGDKVKFLNDIGEGKITKIVSESLVNVEIEDGFEVPTKVSELVLSKSAQEITSGLNDMIELDREEFEEKIEEKVESIFNSDPEEYIIGNDRPHTLMAIIPQYTANNYNGTSEFYLINDSNLKILYSVNKIEDNKYIHLDAGLLDANTKISFFTYKQIDLSKELVLNIQMIYYMIRSYEIISPVNKNIIIDTLQIITPDELATNEYFSEKAHIIDLQIDLEKEIEKMENSHFNNASSEKEKKAVKVEYKTPEKEIEEVDLHIEEIVDDHSSLNNSEILEIQMNRFKIALEGAVRNNARRIVFIHGVGNGTLRYEIRKYIDNKYPKLRYQDASYKEYGYGATMVMI